MRFVTIIWEEGPDGNVEHIQRHQLSPEEVDEVLQDLANEVDESESSGLPSIFGYTSTGRYIVVVFEEIDEFTVYPVTSYDVAEPRD